MSAIRSPLFALTKDLILFKLWRRREKDSKWDFKSSISSYQCFLTTVAAGRCKRKSPPACILCHYKTKKPLPSYLLLCDISSCPSSEKVFSDTLKKINFQPRLIFWRRRDILSLSVMTASKKFKWIALERDTIVLCRARDIGWSALWQIEKFTLSPLKTRHLQSKSSAASSACQEEAQWVGAWLKSTLSLYFIKSVLRMDLWAATSFIPRATPGQGPAAAHLLLHAEGGGVWGRA